MQQPRAHLALIALLAALVVLGGAWLRGTQQRAWDAAPERHYVDGTPLPTTLDAQLWLRYAEGEYRADDRLRAWPDGKRATLIRPLLSALLSGLPAEAVVISWWDHGYLIQRQGRVATLHDGGAKGRTQEVARALVAEDPAALRKLVAAGPDVPVYLLLDRTLIGKYATIDRIARGGTDLRGYQPLRCDRLDGPRVYCGDTTINLQTGETDSGIALEQLVVLRDGRHAGEQRWQRDTDVVLYMTMDGDKLAGLQLTTEPVHRSLFNRLFVLGETLPGLSLVHDGPDVRLWRLDQG